jgi:hypothetical protein
MARTPLVSTHSARQLNSNNVGSQSKMWHVVFAEPGRLPQSRAARSRDAAIHVACELLAESYDVRRILEPNGMSIERAELDEHYDEGRFPGLHPRKQRNPLAIDIPQPLLLS